MKPRVHRLLVYLIEAQGDKVSAPRGLVANQDGPTRINNDGEPAFALLLPDQQRKQIMSRLTLLLRLLNTALIQYCATFHEQLSHVMRLIRDPQTVI